MLINHGFVCAHQTILRHYALFEVAGPKDDKRLGIIRIHRGIVCLWPTESHSHDTHIGSKCSRFFPTSYVYIQKHRQKEREVSALRMVYSTNSSAAIAMAAGLIVLHCYNSSLAKRLTLAT